MSRLVSYSDASATPGPTHAPSLTWRMPMVPENGARMRVLPSMTSSSTSCACASSRLVRD
ncbi:MAG: hypothetical protein U0168_31410 [Nannocystaceae bacterium]